MPGEPQEAAVFTLDNRPTYCPKMLAAEVARLESDGIYTGIPLGRVLRKANSWTFPRGFEPGRGYMLMAGKDVIDITTGNNGINLATHTLRIYKGTKDPITFQKLIITNAYAITGEALHSDQTLYLVEIADLRILGPLTSVNKAYNIKTPDLQDTFDDTQNAGTNWTFEQVVTDLWTFIPSGTMGSLTVSEASFSGSPVDYAFRGVTAWDALRKVLTDTEHTLLLSREGTFSVVSSFTDTGALSEAQETAEEFLLSHSHDQYSEIAKFPATWRVFFPKRDFYWHGNSDTKVITPNDHHRLNPLYSVDVTTTSINSDLTTIAGTVLPIHDSNVAEYSATGSISNAATLSTRATLLATRAINARLFADGPAHFRYSRAQSFNPDATVAAVSWYDFGDGMITEIRCCKRSEPISPLLDPPAHAWSSLPEKLVWSAFEPNTPPDIARWQGLGIRVVMARLTGGNLTSGSTQTATLYYWNGSALVASTKTLTVRDFFLGSGDIVEDETKIVAIELFPNQWVVIAAYCEPV
jgi:hypothetical protein